MTARCHWDAGRGWLSPEHLADCNDRDCAGCRPCGRTHCAMKGRCANHLAHGVLTCPSCVDSVRKDLRVIEDRFAELEEQAAEMGVNSEALNLRGPAALQVPMAPSDPHHPLLVLGRWEMMLREDYDTPTWLALTLPKARDYLDRILMRMANDDEQDFELFAREVGNCRAHIEDVLADSRKPEKGAPCPGCRTEGVDPAPRLHKVWADRVADDRWQCPRVESHWWTEADYRAKVDGDYLEHAAALTADQMREQWGVKPGTLRRWANEEPPRVRKRGYDQHGRQLYDVADARECLDGRPTLRVS